VPTHELGRALKRLGCGECVILFAGGTAQRVLQPIWNSVRIAEGFDPLMLVFFGGSAVGRKSPGL